MSFFWLSALNLDFGRTTNIPTERGGCLDSIGGGGEEIKTTVLDPHPQGEILTLYCLLCQQLAFTCLPTQSGVSSLASWLWTLSMWQSKSALLGSWQVCSVQAGLKLWWFVICFGWETFLCNVFLCYNWKQCCLSVENLKRADQTSFNFFFLFQPSTSLLK